MWGSPRHFQDRTWEDDAALVPSEPLPKAGAHPLRETVSANDVAAIVNQIAQARSILADAVGKLAHSFGSLDVETASQRRIIEGLLATLSSGASAETTDILSIRVFAQETQAVLEEFTDLLATVSKQSIKTVYRIDDMTQELDGIFQLVTSIDEIAEETYLLAINASIEAAHAGENGNAFTVIATNVRALSKRTRTLNEQIGSQIGKARKTVEDVRRIIGEMASRDLNVALAGKERVQHMLEKLASFERLVADTLAQVNGITGRISEAAAQAVTGLQFEDILTQLLGTVTQRVRNLASGARPEGEVGPGRSQPRDVVQQQSMEVGKVELF
jgi:methyl-accepting chemotaxis protein